jgi:multiple sugar transport system substrate-binding protein
LSLDIATARARMPSRVACFYFDGTQAMDAWAKIDAGYQYGLARWPTGNDKVKHNHCYFETGSSQLWVYAKTKYPQVAGDLLHYIGSVDGQAQLVRVSGGSRQSVIPAANAKAKEEGFSNPHAADLTALVELDILGPSLATRNPDGYGKVQLELKAVTPNINDVVTGLLTGQLKDVTKELAALDDRSDKMLDAAIAAARAKGAKISRDDWVFPNWKPDTPYTIDDYKALPDYPG